MLMRGTFRLTEPIAEKLPVNGKDAIFWDRNLADCDNAVAEGPKDWSHLVDILAAVPGIDRAAARAVLVELWPEADAFPSRRRRRLLKQTVGRLSPGG